MKKTKLVLCLAASLAAAGGRGVLAQENPPTPIKPAVQTASQPSVNSAAQNLDVSRERREQAYAKMLEGQRYMWNVRQRQRTSAVIAAGARLAKQAFQKAVELDPNLAEGYTALAELALNAPPGDVDETIMLARIAAKINPDSFAAHRIAAVAYSLKSRIGTENLDASAAQNAIAEWKEVARLDPRFAEAWAFLSALYARTNRTDEQIAALKMWQASATPVETRYYRAILGARESLSPDAGTLKLGTALIKAGRAGEAVEVLSDSLSDDPENAEVIDLIKQAVASGGTASPATLQALQQAVNANPGNTSLIELLAQTQSRAGKTDDAAKSLRASIAALRESDKNSAANLQVSLGDLYAEARRTGEAVAAYEESLKIQGIDRDVLNNEDEREFATRVFDKIIETYKNAGKITEARATIERARILLGKNDLFADKHLISLLRENNQKTEALQAVRNLRAQMKDDYSLIRLEASLLTDLGRVDEGVTLIKTLIIKKDAPVKNSAAKTNFDGNGVTVSTTPSAYYDDFTNYIFISGLYNQAKRTGDAIEAARRAASIADSSEKKQMAALSLAVAQQSSGDYESAEQNLRALLKEFPNNPIALNNLGYFLIERNKKIEEAIGLIQRALEIDPTNPSYLDSLGWAYFKLGNYNQAELYLKEAVFGNPTSAIYEHLGDLYQKQGKTDSAKSAWQKAVKLSSDPETAARLNAKLEGKTVK